MRRELAVFRVIVLLLTMLSVTAYAGTIHLPEDMKGMAYGVMAGEQPYTAAPAGPDFGIGVQSFDPLDNWHLVNPLFEGGSFMALATDSSAVTPKGIIVALIDTGTVAKIVVSNNGIDWVTEAYVVGGKPNALLFVPGLGTPGYGRFVAVGGAMIAYSDNGTFWTQVYSGGGDQIYDVTIGKNAAADVFVAVGTAGKIMTSSTGEYWTAEHVDDISKTLNGVAYGNGTFIAVGDGCKIRLSSDSRNWTTFPRTVTEKLPSGCSTSTKLKSIAFGKGRFVVTTDKDIIYSTTDGVQWKRNFAAMAHNINRVNFMNDKFIAIGNYGTILSSPDGLIWTVENFKETADPNFTGIALKQNGTYMLVGKGIITTSPALNSPIWETWNLQSKNILNSIVYGNNGFIAAGDSLTIQRSPDANVWTNRVFGGGTSSYHFKGVTFGNNKFVAVGGTTTEDLIITSDDGNTWTEMDLGTSVKILNGVTFGNNQFMAVGAAGTILTSPDTNAWTMNSLSDTGVVLYGVIYGGPTGGNKFVAVGDKGKGFTSTDGIAWTANPVTTSATTSLYGVTYGGPAGSAKFISVGNDTATSTKGGKIYTSPDGITWTAITAYPKFYYGSAAAPVPALYGVFWDIKSKYFYAVGEKATVLTSADGMTWTVRVNDPELFPSDITKFGTGTATLRSITYGNNVYVAVGNVTASYAAAGLILKSDPLVPPAPVNINATSTSNSAIRLTWDDRTNEQNFKLYRKKGTGAWDLLATLAADENTYTDTTATGNNIAPNAYSYYLTAGNTRFWSPASKTVIVPYQPTGLTATPATGKITLNWVDVANDTGYEIYRKPGACAAAGTWTLVGTVAVSVKTFANTGLPAKTAYSYKIRSLNKTAAPVSYGYSNYTACVSKATP